MSFREEHEKILERAAKAERETREARSWFLFLEAHRGEIVACQANWQIVKSYFRDEEVTLEGLEEAIQNPAFRNQLSTQTPERDRAKSLATIQKITGLIPVTAKWQSNGELAAKANELETRRELVKKSPDELRQIIRAGQQKPPELDSLPPEMDRKYLLGLPAADLRRVIDRFGTPAVNRRLAGTSI